MNSKKECLSDENNSNDEINNLFSRCKLGDKNAFERLYKLSSAKLNGIAYRITGNVDCASEVLQEAFIQIWQNKNDYHAHKGDALTWMSSIVRYRAYDKIRHNKARFSDQHMELNEFDHAHEFNLENYHSEVLDRCMHKLDSQHRKSILLAYLYGYSRDEIASHFDNSSNTVKSWIRRGLGRLKLCLNN